MAYNPRKIPRSRNPELNKALSSLVRLLLKSRGMTGKELGTLVGLSEISVSKLVTGKARPRKKKFEQVADVLCGNQAERELLERAYHYPLSVEFGLENLPPDKLGQEGHQRAKLKLAGRAPRAALRKCVRGILDTAGASYEQEYVVGDIAVDFLITYDSPDGVQRQLALVCEADPATPENELKALSLYIASTLYVDRSIVLIPDSEKERETYRLKPQGWQYALNIGRLANYLSLEPGLGAKK